MRLLSVLFCCLCAGLLAWQAAPLAQAHPDDEFCALAGDMAPPYCRALQAIDRGENPSILSARQVPDRSASETLRAYIAIGYRHIWPGGWDHILFVLALCFAAFAMRDLLWQVSMFTLAHTLTLGMVAAGVFAPDPGWVEPLIAITIAILAIEIMFFPALTRWRMALIFVFGLIHGMGFAGFFGTLGLPESQFWSALIGFNIGVEAGQIAVILGALLLLWPLRMRLSSDRFHRFVALPACSVIGCIALVWTLQRVFGA